jgi:hypothetical protein
LSGFGGLQPAEKQIDFEKKTQKKQIAKGFCPSSYNISDRPFPEKRIVLINIDGIYMRKLKHVYIRGLFKK